MGGIGSFNRRNFLGGSDSRIIMGADEAALVRLWREKRGELELEDLSGNLIVQLGVVTEPLNRRWYEANTGAVLKDIQRWVKHPILSWMAATLDGLVEGTGAVFEAKFMLPWSFSEETAAEKQWRSSSTTCGSSGEKLQRRGACDAGAPAMRHVADAKVRRHVGDLLALRKPAGGASVGLSDVNEALGDSAPRPNQMAGAYFDVR